MVLGESHNLGWTATASGRDLGEPTLVDGYANGWEVPASAHAILIHLEWKPQKVVWASLALSALAVIVCLVLLCWPRRRHGSAATAGGADPHRRPFDAAPSMPRQFRFRRLLRYAGPVPSATATTVTVVATLVVFGAVIGPVAGLILAGVAGLALRVPRARPLLTVGSPALLALSAAYIVVKQVVDHLPSGFDWPTYFERVHQVAWCAVALLVLDVLIDRLWLRRWWPTDDSPT
jgi:arabinofuranan 3-O-arabinosyltransferase